MASRHRGLFRVAVVLAAAVFVSGAVVTVRSYQDTAGPGGAVRGYFAALEHDDAAAALGFGALPPGQHLLLTATVLRAQQRIAPIADIRIGRVRRSGNRATVAVDYALQFATGSRQIADSVQVVHSGRRWRLTRTAVPTQIRLLQAVDRATILGARLPHGPVLLFPGAVPVAFTTSDLQLAPGTDTVAMNSATPDGTASTDLTVQVSPLGRSTVLAAVTAALQACVKGGASVDPTCPLPSDRYVPGALHGSFPASATDHLSMGVSADPSGVIEIDNATVEVTGHYTVLDFNNQPVARSGRLALPITATIYPTTPVTIVWGGAGQ
jgi:hypothetical protein